MTGPQPTEDELLMDLIKTNRRTDGDSLTKEQYEKHGEHNPWQAANRFNTWNEARASAGIYKENVRPQEITDKDILDDLKKVHDENKLTVDKYREQGRYSITLIYDRFDSFTSAKNKAYKD